MLEKHTLQAGIAAVNSHALRHTFATRYLSDYTMKISEHRKDILGNVLAGILVVHYGAILANLIFSQTTV